MSYRMGQYFLNLSYRSNFQCLRTHISNNSVCLFWKVKDTRNVMRIAVVYLYLNLTNPVVYTNVIFCKVKDHLLSFFGCVES